MTAEQREFDLIDWIRRRAPKHDRLTLGIGDDTASLQFPDPADCLITVDMLMEGVHFTLPPATPRQVGHKALGVNLSDIAAMAGRPLAAVISLALPRGHSAALAEGLYAGIGELAKRYQVAIAGGDTNSWDGPLVISVTLLGEMVGNGPVLRSGAKRGDWIFVTGEFGGSLLGRHLDFEPRISEALALHAAVDLHAMIDVSDGLSADLAHITEESHVGAVLYESAIPLSQAARTLKDNRTALQHALGDGEDFELLFTVSPRDGQHLLNDPPTKTPISRIGHIVEPAGLQLRTNNGNIVPLSATGWEHLL